MAVTILASQLEPIADALEAAAGAVVSGANTSKAGQWLRIASAAELLGGAQFRALGGAPPARGGGPPRRVDTPRGEPGEHARRVRSAEPDRGAAGDV